MTRKRTNFKAMDCGQFIAYLNNKSIHYDKFITTTVMGISVVKVNPNHFRMTPRIFDRDTNRQLDSKVELTDIDITKPSLKQFIKLVDKKIKEMSTKGVYHPRRLKPKWDSLKNDKDKLELFTKYMKAPTSSIGFIRLIMVNLPNKTLESILIDYPQYESLIKIEGIRERCIKKFMAYKNGKEYLKSKRIN
ncbi:hypothetical protein Q4Q34_03215 [Flavivirga abyssicola]|uniref:hypothetical protein n=1 Tax=Flavivirga abyssicola TaxID=3063533 RepID=UPI0026E04CA6|nr:hypothetical protein [Flavivirga sp. MEBiC07777]WVK14042.1 hypothetical protein Q4Q34_03215 [Flavivirga sp. MEBiC07777]